MHVVLVEQIPHARVFVGVQPFVLIDLLGLQADDHADSLHFFGLLRGEPRRKTNRTDEQRNDT